MLSHHGYQMLPESHLHHGSISLIKPRLPQALRSRLLTLMHRIQDGPSRRLSTDQVNHLMLFEIGEELGRVSGPNLWHRRVFARHPCRESHLLLLQSCIGEASELPFEPKGKEAVSLRHSRAAVAPTAFQLLLRKQAFSRHQLRRFWPYAMLTKGNLWSFPSPTSTISQQGTTRRRRTSCTRSVNWDPTCRPNEKPR